MLEGFSAPWTNLRHGAGNLPGKYDRIFPWDGRSREDAERQARKVSDSDPPEQLGPFTQL